MSPGQEPLKCALPEVVPLFRDLITVYSTIFPSALQSDIHRGGEEECWLSKD